MKEIADAINTLTIVVALEFLALFMILWDMKK